MKENPLVVRGNPKNLDSGLNEIRMIREELHQEGTLPIEGEIEKTPEDKEAIDAVNSYLQQLFQDLKLPYEPIPYERVHFLSNEVFISIYQSEDEREGSDTLGFHEALKGAVYLNKDFSVDSTKSDAFYRFSNLMHEVIHFQSKVKVIADTDEREISPYRTGYSMHNLKKSHFVGLNEGIVEATQTNLILKYRNEVAQRTGLNPNEVDRAASTHKSYRENVDLVMKIANDISISKHEPHEQSFNRLLREQFTGNLMHLREIEEIYGTGSLRLLARYGSEKDLVLDQLIFRFFMDDEPQNRIMRSRTIEAYDGKKARAAEEQEDEHDSR